MVLSKNIFFENYVLKQFYSTQKFKLLIPIFSIMSLCMILNSTLLNNLNKVT